MLRKNYCLVTFGLFFLITSYVFAQTATELRIGTWVSGNLREGAEIWYNVRSVGSGIITVETRGNIDTYLEAYHNYRNKISEDDDSGEDSNARLEIYTEPGMTYLIKLRGYDDDESGPYRIIASFEEIAPDIVRNTERSRSVILSHDQQVPVFFRTPNESRWYRYDLPRSQNLLIVQTRGSMDTLLSLYDVQGNLITTDDDSGEDANALISRRLGRGTVYIEVRTYDGKTGRTTLEAENWYRD